MWRGEASSPQFQPATPPQPGEEQILDCDCYDGTYQGTPTMMLRVTTAAWQQNMCTGAYLPTWEGEHPAYKTPTYDITLL